MKKKKMETYSMRLPEYLIKKVKDSVDGINYSSPSQIVRIALYEWLERQATKN